MAGTLKQNHLFKILAVLLVLAAWACAVSANTLTLGSVNLQKVGDQGVIDLYLDTVPPHGVAGYSVTFTITDTSVADIVGVKYPNWAVQGFSSGSPGTNNVNIKVADVGDIINTTTPAPVYLGSVQVEGLAGGTTDITITADQVDAEDGSPVNPAVTKGTIAVQLPPGPSR